MTAPAWDGEGRDPWLPDRLDAIAGFAAGERTIYDDYFARLSGWLTAVNRGVTAGPAPDPTAVFAHEPAWAASMDEFVQGPVRAQMATAYDAVLGEGFLFDQRPAVASYLGEVRNRMVGVPDQVYGLVASQIAEGSGLGESIPDLAARVDGVLSATDTPRWANRATTVARTEAIGAANFGRYDSFLAMADELPGEEFELMWLSTLDGSTRPSHAAADGQRVPVREPFNVGGSELRFPGDPFGPADEVINCRCSVLMVRPGEGVDLSDRQFKDTGTVVTPPSVPEARTLLGFSGPQLDSAARQVYETSFGNFGTTVVGVDRPDLGGLEGVRIRGNVVDANGVQAGEFTRFLLQGPDGKLAAYHDFLTIDSGLRGQGIAKAFNDRLEQWYRASGVDRIELVANISVGGYAWARAGYDFADERTAASILKQLSIRADNGLLEAGVPIPAADVAAAKELLDRAERIPFGSPGYPSAYEVSQLGRPPGAGRDDIWLGKRTLLGSSWDAVKPL